MARRTSRKQRLESMLNQVVSPCFLVDGDRRLLFANAGCEQLTGWPAEELLGLRCELTSGTGADEPGSVTENLAPPQEVFSGELLQIPRYFVHRQTRRSVARLVHFFPLKDDGSVLLVLGIVTDVPPARTSTGISVITEVHAELAALRHELRLQYGQDSIIGRTPQMRRVCDQIEIARQSRSIVHLTGEPGTGRGHLTRVLHYTGRTGQRPFVPLNCRDLSVDELAGAIHRLTNAEWSDVSGGGALQPGGIYLEEVDALPRDLQMQLVAFLSNRESAGFFNRCRLFTSSVDSPDVLLKEERLTDELYYRITPLQIELPPLRRRLADLRLLGQSFLEQCNRRSSRQVTGMSEDVWRQFEAYGWPGNIAELRDVVREAHAACDGSVISTAHLPFRFRDGLDAQQLGPAPDASLEPLEDLVARVEREHILEAMRRARGSRSQAARLLGISRPSLYRRLEAHHLLSDDAVSDGTATE